MHLSWQLRGGILRLPVFISTKRRVVLFYGLFSKVSRRHVATAKSGVELKQRQVQWVAGHVSLLLGNAVMWTVQRC